MSHEGHKNRTVQYLDSLEESRREDILKKAISYGRKQRDRRKKNQKQLRVELIRRQDEKIQVKDAKIRKQVEKKLKEGGLDAVVKLFPTITENEIDREKVMDLLEGRAIGRNIVHVWELDGERLPYNGRIEKLCESKRKGSRTKLPTGLMTKNTMMHRTLMSLFMRQSLISDWEN